MYACMILSSIWAVCWVGKRLSCLGDRTRSVCIVGVVCRASTAFCSESIFILVYIIVEQNAEFDTRYTCGRNKGAVSWRVECACLYV